MANVEFEAAKKKSDEAQEKLDALPEDTNSNTKAKESPSSPIERPGKTSFTLEPMSPTRGSINSLQPE